MLGDLMRVAQPDTTVWITDPSYVNHKPVMDGYRTNVGRSGTSGNERCGVTAWLLS
ncbi:aromatic amino acid aminotransferase [Vibrio cholerae]|nr:aromatic amino acid aminotransferase [Vibrio cholerae]